MDVKPLHAVLIVCVFVVLVGLAAYSGTQARLIQGPSDLRLDRAGQLHLRIGQGIFVYDRHYQLVNSYSLDRFGIDGLLGSFDFFADNSLLLVAEAITPEAQTDAGRLLRCSFDSDSCLSLDSADYRFKTSFRVSVDERDEILLADTASDTIYRLDAQGGEMDSLSSELNRPNQVLHHSDQLVIANTDAMELLLVPLDESGFAARSQWQHIPMDSAANTSRRERRPIDFLYLDSAWFVLAKTKDMRRGGIYQYSDGGEYQSNFELPEGTDPFAVAYLGESIVVADYANLQVYRYSTDGKLLGNLDSPEQREHIERIQQRQAKFSLVEYTSWGVFAIALVVGFVIAIRGELKKANRKRVEKDDRPKESGPAQPTTRPHAMDSRIHWLVPKKTALWLMLLALGLTLAMPLVVGMGMPETDDPENICARYTLKIMMWGFTGMMLLIFVPLAIKMRSMMLTRIGVCDEWVLVDHGNGTVRTARDEDLVKAANGFIIDSVTVATGNHQMPLYNRKELKKWLQPRLEHARTQGPMQQLTWQWHNRRGLFILSAVAIVLGLALVVALETGWFEEHFERWVQRQPACWDARGEQGVDMPGQIDFNVPGLEIAPVAP